MLKTNRLSSSTASSNNPTKSSNNNYKQRLFVSSSDECTSSDSIDIVNKHKKNTLRALSDYESDDNNVVTASNSLASSSKDSSTNAKFTKKPTFHSEISFINKQNSSSSSDSEDSIIVRSRRNQKSLRQLSDYETDESIDNIGNSLSMASVDHSLVNSSSFIEQSNNFHAISDDDSFYNIRRMKCKRTHYLSTSASSDSDIPVTVQSSRKRKRVIVSSEESEDENLAQSSRLRQRKSTRSINRIVSSVRPRPQMGRQQNQRRYVESETENDSNQSSRLRQRRSTRSINRIVSSVRPRPQTGRQQNRRRYVESETENDSDQSSRLRQRRSTRSINRIVSSVRPRPQTGRQQNRRRYVESETENDSDQSSRLRQRRSTRSINRIVSSVRPRPQMRRQQSWSYIESETENDSSDDYFILRRARINNVNSRRQRNRRGVVTRNNSNPEQSNNRPSVLERHSPGSFTEYRGQSQRSSGTITLFYSQGGRNHNVFTISGRSSTTPRGQIFSSSDSDNSLPLRTRTRGSAVPILDSDSDSNNDQNLPNVSSNPSASQPKVTLTSTVELTTNLQENSSDSEADSEKCPICFSCFGSKEVASPVSCDHLFCTTCIQEWAKNNNTCPIDRKTFNKIMVRSSFNCEVVREITVEDPQELARAWQIHTFFANDEINTGFPIYDISSSEEDEEICCICFSSNASGDSILCDFCNNIYHMSCLTPPLRYVPASDWFCPTCVQREIGSD